MKWKNELDTKSHKNVKKNFYGPQKNKNESEPVTLRSLKNKNVNILIVLILRKKWIVSSLNLSKEEEDLKLKRKYAKTKIFFSRMLFFLFPTFYLIDA